MSGEPRVPRFRIVQAGPDDPIYRRGWTVGPVVVRRPLAPRDASEDGGLGPDGRAGEPCGPEPRRRTSDTDDDETEPRRRTSGAGDDETEPPARAAVERHAVVAWAGHRRRAADASGRCVREARAPWNPGLLARGAGRRS